jgi:hypothetical protein
MRNLLFAVLVAVTVGLLMPFSPAHANGTGRVAVYPENPHYLMDAHGVPFLLVGLSNEKLDDAATLRKLRGDINYMRAYFAVFVRTYGWNEHWENEPWQVVDGQVDMDTWKDAYWQKLRRRLKAAQQRNIVVGLTVWDGHTALPGGKAGDVSFWNADYNVQGIQWAYNVKALKKYTHPRKTGGPAERLVYYQRRVVDKLIAEIRDLPNVIIELNNEDAPGSSPKWWRWWAQYFKDKGFVVAVNEADSGGISDRVFSMSPAIDMKSYHQRTADVLTSSRYRFSKALVADADSRCTGLDPDKARRLAWQSILRGGGWNDFVCKQQPFPNETKAAYYGHLLKFFRAQHVPFWDMAPRGDLVSSHYALVNPGIAYLVYAEKDVEVDLTEAHGTLDYQWFDPRTGKTVASGTVAGRAEHTFTIPAATHDYILWITAKGDSAGA